MANQLGGNKKSSRDKFVRMGAEDEFDGLGVIKANFRRVVPDFYFHETLKETCKDAVNLATTSKTQ